MRYIRLTIDLMLTLSADNFNAIKWWVDASYAVHPNMHGHTGATMTLGKGSICSISSKQKINMRSSTESELIGMNDVLGQILWTRNFLADQGYNMEPSTVMQDNKSAMLLENNGILLSSKQTKHISVRYYFIKDNIERGEINCIYCPTGEMIGDFFTKPLHGSQFIKFRDAIIGVSHSESIVKECVEETEAQRHRDLYKKTMTLCAKIITKTNTATSTYVTYVPA